MSINFIPHDTKIDFVKNRFIFFAIFGALIFVSILALAIRGVNYGVDFKGGYLLEVRSQEKPNIGEMRSNLSKLGLGDVTLQGLGSGNDVLVRVQNIGLSLPKDRELTLGKIKSALGDIEYRRVESVGPQMGKELITDGIYASLAALLLILLYIWIRFEWQFAVCGILSLLNDGLAVLGFYGIFHSFEFNTNALIAILTTLSYSINDAVVIFDRIRENMRKTGTKELTVLINKSVNETLSRTILTSFTTALALFVLYCLGGEVIASFSMPILFGIIVGTFSSICLAAPMLIYTGAEKVMRSAGVPGKFS
ncbi:MAG: protein translocase subunit SecF [Holosporales bacterium]|nr:protein translocase subunit SecF [Holosporales bacterium]